MSCVIQNQLARILAEFEMTLERDVLQPLSRLSEVTLSPAPGPPSPHPSSLPRPTDPPCLPPGGAASHPETQEEPAEAGLRLERPQGQVGLPWAGCSAPSLGTECSRPWPVHGNTCGEGTCEAVHVLVTASVTATPKSRIPATSKIPGWQEGPILPAAVDWL